MTEKRVHLKGVREHHTGFAFLVDEDIFGESRPAVAVLRQGERDTAVDLLDLLKWIKANRPDLLVKAGIGGDDVLMTKSALMAAVQRAIMGETVELSTRKDEMTFTLEREQS